jgi:hypothetical protein
MENPIKNCRIVNDKTFALRLKNFISDIRCNDFASEEEKEYLIMVADKLLLYQIETAKEQEEINYLKNNGKFFCK